eukprot:CAMPEP_0185488530 /NCGR_PEP_ID=MMETSP1366-20130426/12478_1 /TAXON_ID=38817 /ORGANISM="Gephyrocapsa oceanica, Strain RCC1303" /LENGTH=105 /DNA_ID=CAMNT_0028097025 /DNA_START=117 /DNA_END=431 /DNA_ORIENTATION=+
MAASSASASASSAELSAAPSPRSPPGSPPPGHPPSRGMYPSLATRAGAPPRLCTSASSTGRAAGGASREEMYTWRGDVAAVPSHAAAFSAAFSAAATSASASASP